ncbi:MAG: HAD-IB family phosphatase, partial [Sphingorhabdus sp.]|nr:HAD-IB family phosphatase [Sphingorhabdus sp.]
MQKIAIYDLDRTILKKPTFTAFLIFAARAKQRALWWRAPIWVFALLGYLLKLYDRKAMKQFGMRLFIGAYLTREEADRLARAFTAQIVPSDILPGAARMMAADKADGFILIIASAAQEIYVAQIARALQFHAFVATRNQETGGAYRHLLQGENCYGAEKLRRVTAWMDEQKWDRSQCFIRCYSDHPSDAPLLDWADEAILISAEEQHGILA